MSKLEPLDEPSCTLMQTVIECLKQACTGELPPNTRSGQSFIHDPRVSAHALHMPPPACSFYPAPALKNSSMHAAVTLSGRTGRQLPTVGTDD
eukprot:scaffold78847_cov14-Tisochrysis_lutea.AAC.1